MSTSLVVDSSAWVAITMQEPDARWLEEALAGAQDPVMSAGTLQEVICVLGRKHLAKTANAWDFADLVTKTARAQGIRIVPVDATGATLGAAGWMRFRGRPARLNLGDGFAYALAIQLDAPILCKGADFIHTNAKVLRPPTDD